MAMEAPLFFRLAELTPPLSLPDERRLADAGQLNNLRVGMVLKQSHCMVKLQDRQRYLFRHHHRHARRSYCAALYRLDRMYPPLTADLQEQEKHRPLSD